MDLIVQKVETLWPEIALLIGAVACLITGLAPSKGVRKATPWVAGLALVAAALLVPAMGPNTAGIGLGGMVPFAKLSIIGVGLILLLVSAGVPGQLRQIKRADAAKTFEPGDVFRGEFFAFFLLSLTGAMMTAGAGDLVWLFLALELTSLPTYVMVATSRDNITAQESAIKYFFLGAMSAAMFLYGFTLIYGATGFTDFHDIHTYVSNNAISPLLLTGIVLSFVGICFKIAAVPMHFYAADVYQGATTSVTAFLAFVPKTAGFLALILLIGLVGWPLDLSPNSFGNGDVIVDMIWVIAAVTMTLGNVLALIQSNVKRALAYSSVAHSGYILVGLLAGTAFIKGGPLADGIAAILFYLVAYGLATIAGFAVLGCIEAHGDEAETYDDITGLYKKHPGLAAIMLISMLSLMGMPLLIGFVGKLYLIGSVYEAGFTTLVVILVINSAISAAYYLRIASTCFFGKPAAHVRAVNAPARRLGAAIAAAAVILLGIPGGLGGGLVDYAFNSTAGARDQKAVGNQTAEATPHQIGSPVTGHKAAAADKAQS